jgi:plasmid stabilization system protein ParE
MLDLRVLKPAAHELREAAHWYAQEDAQLSHRFIDEIDRIIEHARQFPDAATSVEDIGGLQVRRFLSTAFPYRVITTEWSGKLVVIAVSHKRRESYYWRPRLAKVKR